MQTQKIALIGLLVAGILMTACQSATTQAAGISGNTQKAPAAAATALPTRVVAATTSVAADGALALATPLITAAFDTSGKVTAVNVAPGQRVKKGDVLAELDPTTLNTALLQAQENLALQQAQIAKSLAPAKQTDIDNAKASLNSAYAAYAELKKGPSANTVEQALRTWNEAKNSLYATQLDRDSQCGLKPGYSSEDDVKKAMGDPHCKRADLGVQSAELRERSAYQAYLDSQAPTAQNDLTKAWATVVQAQTSLATLQNGVTDAQKAIYDLQIKQLEITIERAQNDLQKARLLSPCDCVVQEVTLSTGATASSSTGVTLLDTTQITFQTTNLNERDVVKIKTGAVATIRLKAFTGTFTGTVDSVLPVSSGLLSTVALYTTIIDLDPNTLDLRPGMTGQAEISLQ